MPLECLCICFSGCFPLYQRFRKFRSEFKCKSPFWFQPTGIFGIPSGGGSFILVGIFRPKFAVPFLKNRFFALIRELGRWIKSGKSHSYWLARFNRKMPFHFPPVFPLIPNPSVWHNGKHPPSTIGILVERPTHSQMAKQQEQERKREQEHVTFT